MTASLITPTPGEKMEWSRLATDAYATDRNFYGHRYSMAAALRDNESLPTEYFDVLQSTYRRWLVGGWEAIGQA